MLRVDVQADLPLSRTRILAAALRLTDGGGVESLSMRKLAGELGVKAMSLYNHVANKDDIIDSIVDMVVGEIRIPGLHDDWKTAMRRRATSAHEVLLRHRWATIPLVSRVNAGPAMFRYVDATIGCLRGAGFSFQVADGAKKRLGLKGNPILEATATRKHGLRLAIALFDPA